MAQVLPFRPSEATPDAAAAPARVFLGDILVRSGKLPPERLERALVDQRGQDATLGHILIVERAITPQDLTEALSEQSRLGPADLDAEPPDPVLAGSADPYRCLALEAIPWRRNSGRRVIAVANPAANGAAALAEFAAPGEEAVLAIAPAAAIRRAVGRIHGPRMAAEAETRCPPQFSCRTLLRRKATWRASWRTTAVVMTLGLALAAAPLLVVQLLLGWVLIANAATMALRLVALATRLGRGPARIDERLHAEPPEGVTELRRLPPVSLLVPLKGEAAVAGQLMAALGRMDYPAPLLDIKLVLESCDHATLAAVEAAGMPPTVEVVIVPPGAIQTKPRAMNYALPFCRGEIVGVYDAEDLPDPRQIRAVVRHLTAAGPEVACVQGYLDFYNTEANWLSRCFAIEYATWFRVILPGVQRLGVPIPLGGTTVFFRRRALERIGGWDAHNVTEDADLGMRLARFGHVCEMIPTVTLEEANAQSAGRWIRQRSRWLKGYAITWATHMRAPRRLLRDLGWRGFLGFQVLFLGALTSYLGLPLLWTLWLLGLGLGAPLLDGLPAGLSGAAFASMLAGNLVMLATAATALADSGRTQMLGWTLTLPLYWPLGALAAYRAIAEVFYAPFHWHKTEHGGEERPHAQEPQA